MGSSASIKRAKGEDWSENGATLVSLEPGDLVKFQRCGYYHWAVYIGADNINKNISMYLDRHKKMFSSTKYELIK